MSVFDRGFMYGDGVFETMRAYEGRVFRSEPHLDRLAASAATIGITLPFSSSRIVSDIKAVLTRNSLENAVVRVRISRGPIASKDRPTYVVTADTLPEDLAARVQNGIRLSIVNVRKTPDTALPAGAKHANYLNSILALSEAKAKGSDEAVMLTTNGVLAEASSANLFLVRDNTLRTPSLEVGILSGITRAVVLELTKATGMPASEVSMGPDGLQEADEVFVTNSVVGIMPVRQCEERTYTVPGPMTGKLMELYGACIAGEGRNA